MSINFYYIEIISAFIGILCFCFGFLLLLKKSSEAKVTYLSLFSIFASFWILSVYFADISTTYAELVIFTKAATIFGLVLVTCFLSFCWAFKHGTIDNTKIFLFFLQNIILIPIIIGLNEKFIYTEDPFLTYNYEGPIGGTLASPFYIFSLIYLLNYLAGLAILFKNYKKQPYKIKKQIFFICVGVGLTVCGGLFFDCLLPLYGIDLFYSLGPVFSIFFITLTAYSIFKHELFDIKFVIQKSVIYILLISFTFLLFSILLNLSLLFANNSSKSLYIITSTLTTVIGFSISPYIMNFFNKITDKWFYKNTYSYNESLQVLSEIFNKNSEIKTLLSSLESSLIKIFKNEYTKIILVDDDKSSKYNSETTYEIRLNSKLLAKIVLGKKMSGEPYYNKDLQLLKTFSNQAAVALEKVRLFEEVKLYSQNLEKMVKERTNHIKILQKNQKQSLIDISHSLQTPLTIIKGKLNLLQKQFTDYKDLKSIENIVDNASAQIYNLLHLIKLETNSEPFKFKELNLSSLLNEIVEYVQIMCRDKNIQLTTGIEDSVVFYGDRHRLEEMFNSILSNAIKYTTHNKTLKIVLVKNEKIQITISDSGIGIPQAEIHKIFTRFYRASNAKGVSSGSGLGLAIAEQIVKQHKGTISVESVEGQGTTFIIKFPTQS